MTQTDRTGGPSAQVLVHLEIVHSDPEGVFEFLRDCLGAERVEQNIGDFLQQTFGVKGVHAKVGNIVFQILTPTPSLPTWYAELQDRGPGVHNVTFYVDDLEAVKQRMLGQGATEILDMDVPFQEIGLGGDGPTRLLVMDAREQTGLRFEMCQPIDGWIPYPARAELPE